MMEAVPLIQLTVYVPSEVISWLDEQAKKHVHEGIVTRNGFVKSMLEGMAGGCCQCIDCGCECHYDMSDGAE